MPAPHLRLEVVRHVVRGELAPLLGDHELEREVQQQVAQLLANRARVGLAQRVVELQHLLDQVGPQRFAGLRPVPGTPGAEVPHHRHRTSKR